ncbi:alpha-galactosidase [Muribaculaceae bacterium Isolate-080 (Janvier)]|nr:alpha-galactosidase [Muribaculaceae bacterium Isolate-080 (Janvier)]
MKHSHIFLSALIGMSMPAIAKAEIVDISTPKTSLILDAEKGGGLRLLHYGNRMESTDIATLKDAGAINRNAYPVYGILPQGEAAMSVTHADGNMTTDVEVTGINTTTAPDGAKVTTIAMRDKVYPFDLNVNYRTYPGEDVIETWVDVTNNEKGTVRLNRFMSGYLPVRYGDVWLSQLYGSWANEGKLSQTPLNHGVRMIKNKDGVRNSHTSHAEIMLSLDGKPQENTGRTIGAALEYSGNYKLFIDTDDSDYHHFFAGINEENSAYNLKKGESFVTPPLALTYSEEGLSGVSRNFHRWGRNHRLHNGDKERSILLNSWEGVYFDIDEAGMANMMKDIADMGGELFVMDDGWFGAKYPRDNDSTSLGDWVVDTDKLPNGIQGLIDTAKANGVKFGIWIEPEMTNTVSELYEKHPEYIIKAANRPATQGRGGTQLVLDLANPKVQDIVFTVVDTPMRKYPEIDYIKWDANAPIMDHGSQYLTADNQSHLYIDYHNGFETVLNRIRKAHPDVTIQACASGGGRANWGVLPWFDEFWTSDNNDALQRIYMQWGTSYFFPAIAMGSHISASPNHQTFRRIPVKFRADVAMSGRLGLELQPKNMTDEEKAIVKNAIADYKKIRPIVQFGDIYRLVSPYDGKGIASLMYVNPDKNDAVFYWWKTETFMNQQLPRVVMAGLDPDKTYTVHELNRIDNEPLSFEGKSFTGRYLMSNGLEIPLTHRVDYHKNTDYASRILRLTAK